MKLHLIINRAGRMEQSLVYLDDAERLWCTPKAKSKLVEFLEAKSLLCRQCGIAARSDELSSGICKVGIGCYSDVDGDVFKGREAAQREESSMRTVFQKVWRTFLSTLPRDVGRDEPDLIDPDPQASNDGQAAW